MTNLALTKAEAKEESGVEPYLPKYPYGLTLYLNDETLEKLGMTEMPKVGSVLQLQAMVTVTGTSQRAQQTEKESGEPDETTTSCVDLQITDMDLQGPAKDMAKSLYSKSK